MVQIDLLTADTAPEPSASASAMRAAASSRAMGGASRSESSPNISSHRRRRSLSP